MKMSIRHKGQRLPMEFDTENCIETKFYAAKTVHDYYLDARGAFEAYALSLAPGGRRPRLWNGSIPLELVWVSLN